MKRFVVAALTSLALLAGAASANGGSQPTGQIVFGMNHFCQANGANGGGKQPVDCGKGEVAVVNANGSHLRILTHASATSSTSARRRA